jgi:cytochrome c oxidase cbb3-type subunit III
MRRTLQRVAGAWSIVFGVTSWAPAQPATPPSPMGPPDPAAVARGQQLYAQNCVTCHGPTGRGAGDAGSDLSRSAIATAVDNASPGGGQLGAFLKVGRPERRMPSFALPDASTSDLAAYLRTILPPVGAAARGAITAIVVGDAKAGEAYFNGAGRCHTCHSPAGNLRGIGSRLSVAAVQGRLVHPRGTGGYPRSFNSPPDPADAPKTVTVTQPSGEVVEGTLLWITDFNVTLTDAAGVRRTIARRGAVPKVEVVDPLQYHVDHMKILTDENMHNLTAYLVSLK